MIKKTTIIYIKKFQAIMKVTLLWIILLRKNLQKKNLLKKEQIFTMLKKGILVILVIVIYVTKYINLIKIATFKIVTIVQVIMIQKVVNNFVNVLSVKKLYIMETVLLMVRLF